MRRVVVFVLACVVDRLVVVSLALVLAGAAAVVCLLPGAGVVTAFVAEVALTPVVIFTARRVVGTLIAGAVVGLTPGTVVETLTPDLVVSLIPCFVVGTFFVGVRLEVYVLAFCRRTIAGRFPAPRLQSLTAHLLCRKHNAIRNWKIDSEHSCASVGPTKRVKYR